MDTHNYPVTDRTEHVVNGVKLIHEVSDRIDGFQHRLCANGSLGEWRAYEWFAIAEVDGRKFMACQDNWLPMFPHVFEIVGES